MVNETYCSVCDDCTEMSVVNIVSKKNEEISFAALLALVPAMTLTFFNLAGLI